MTVPGPEPKKHEAPRWSAARDGADFSGEHPDRQSRAFPSRQITHDFEGDAANGTCFPARKRFQDNAFLQSDLPDK
jgi:hypothetical protein